MEVPLINAKRAQIVADDGEYLGGRDPQEINN